MDTIDPARFIFSFTLVIGLICLLALFVRQYGSKLPWLARSLPVQKAHGGRLRIVETCYVDARRKLVLLQRDGREHLLLLADGREQLIESFDSQTGSPPQ